MRRVLFFAAIALAVFSCAQGGDNSGTASDTADMMNQRNNNAMGGDSASIYGGSSVPGSGTNTGGSGTMGDSTNATQSGTGTGSGSRNTNSGSGNNTGSGGSQSTGGRQ